MHSLFNYCNTKYNHDDKCVELDSDQLYDINLGTDYLEKHVSDKFDLKLPEFAYDLHKFYIKIMDLVWSKKT